MEASSQAASQPRQETSVPLGVALVFLAALCWSFGGTIERFIAVEDTWTVIFWRSVWAAFFLTGFMLLRDGFKGTIALFRRMGLPGVAVGICFATASTTFVLALSHTTVANILLIYAGAPLFAALIAWLLFSERVSRATWMAIAAVFVGVGIMVSESLNSDVSPIGYLLALIGPICFAFATVLTRRHADVRMTPATTLGALIAGSFALTQVSYFAVPARDMAFLVAFGALNLGLGLAFFASGARLIPAALAALLGTLETILGPLWVWLIHAEVPSARGLAGGGVVFVALIVHIVMEYARNRPARPGTTGMPVPN